MSRDASTAAARALVLSLVAASLCVHPAMAKPEVALFVKAQEANLRSGPGQEYGVVDSLCSGAEVRVRDAKGFWRQVYVPATKRVGWMAHWLLSETPPSGVCREVRYINADTANLREGPGTTGYDRVGVLCKGERVEVIAYQDQWRKVKVPSNGEVGWVAAWLLKGGDEEDEGSQQADSRPANLRFVKVDDCLYLRDGPGVRYRALAKLDRGQRVYLVKTEDKWCQVKVHGTLQVGWVHRDYLSDTLPGSVMEQLPSEVRDLPPFVQPTNTRPGAQTTRSNPSPTPQPLSGSGTIPNGLVNVRSGPGTSYPLVGQASVGAHFTLFEEANAWRHVRFDNGMDGWVASWLAPVSVPAVGPSQPTALGNAIAQEAMRHIGKPYAWGKTGPDRFDCSGLVKYCLSRCGITDYPRQTFGQVKVGNPVSVDQLIPGDIVFFANTYTSGVSHVGIYAGNGQFIHAPQSGERVRVEPLSNRAKSYYCARRVY